jgi:dihydropteroate synthase
MRTTSNWSESIVRSKPLTTHNSLALPSGAFSLERVRIMGILNVTPDSFYDRGRYRTHRAALARAHAMAEEGADILDIGGEKAGPGEPVTVDEEIRRVVPIVDAVRREIALPISVDTFKPEVARAAIQAGADIINSIGGFESPAMREVAVETGAAIVVMHIQGRPRVAHPHPTYGDVVRDVQDWLEERVRLCLEAGIAPDRVIVDPGPDFGKSSRHTLLLLHDLMSLTTGPYPVLLAASRKKFIGDVLGSSVEERLEGSLAVVAWAVQQGVKIVRVHDVRPTRRVVTMIESLLHPECLPGEHE